MRKEIVHKCKICGEKTTHNFLNEQKGYSKINKKKKMYLYICEKCHNTISVVE